MGEAFFVDDLGRFGERLAIVGDDGLRQTYAQLAAAVDEVAAALSGPRRLYIVEAANHSACLSAYLGCLRARQPVLLVEPGSTARDERIARTFDAAAVFCEDDTGVWNFAATDAPLRAPPHPDLAVLLSTSGTTGSPKLVRLSRANIEANARSIVDYLGIVASDRAITALPLFYSYGMSVLHSHLMAGATLLLTAGSVAQDQFWSFFEREGATSLAGVPFTYDVLERIGFRHRNYPTLRYLAQAGGRLPAETVLHYAQWAADKQKQMFVMYGQTEAGPRMAYVPPDQLAANSDCIGVPIPGGAFALVDDAGAAVTADDSPGELVYSGPNVMMGYAETAADLALGAGPDRLPTGDLACRKPNGLYYIVGRRSRFSKILGLRISLDEVERWLATIGAPALVNGDDKLIAVALRAGAEVDAVKRQLLLRFGLPASAVVVFACDPLPTLANGKFDYRAVLRRGQETAAGGAAASSLIDGFRAILGTADMREADSFLDLGGDSINFVEISLLLEKYLGYVPDNWEARSVAELEGLKARGQAGAEVRPTTRGARPRSFVRAALVAIALLAAGEGALQGRSYLRTGRSAFDVAAGNSTIQYDAKLKMRYYRPQIIDDPSDGYAFNTNSLGLRSPEIPPLPAAGEMRLVVIGASTVAGLYAKRDDETMTRQLEMRLRKRYPDRVVNVINAGVEGATVAEMLHLLRYRLIALRPTMVLIYPGLNDVADICQASARASRKVRHAAPAPELPAWVMTREVVAKNTLPLRLPPVRANRVDPASYFPPQYRANLDALVTLLQGSGITPVMMTVARSFKASDGEAGKALAAPGLFFYPCLDYAGLLKAGRLFNDVMVEVAHAHHIDVLDMETAMPSGKDYFVDSSHFTFRGEQTAADIVERALVDEPGLLSRHAPAGAAQ